MQNLNYEEMTNDELIKHIMQLKRDKRYGLIWEEKEENMDEILDYNYPVLTNLNDKDIIVDKDKKMNLLIEGDNLHSLYLLSITHKKSVDLILIDPPYNTGNQDFIYNDKYVDKEDAWRHSKWISFMNRRLSIARKLLKDEGIIFIHIDENEFAQLKLLCDEVFGYDNYVGTFIWKSRGGKGGTNNQIAHEHEYIFCYAKNKEKASLKTNKKIGDARKEQLRQWGQEILRENRPYMFFPLLYKENQEKAMILKEEFIQLYDAKTETFNDDYLETLKEKYEKEGWNFILPIREEGYGRWRVGFETATDLLNKDEIIFEKENDTYKAYRIYEEGNVTESAIGSLILDKGTASTGTKELKQIFKDKVFDTTKPLDVTEFLIDLVMFDKKEGIILDFFAGSGTTGEATLRYNKKDNKNFQFILCTNNEMKEKVKNSLIKKGILESSDKFKNEGVCRKVTHPKIKSVIEGYNFSGKIEEVLKEVKLNTTVLKQINKTFEEFKLIEEKFKDDFDNFSSKVVNDKLQLIGTKKVKEKVEGITANLKYFVTDIIEKNANRDQMKILMAKKIYDLLCIKENCFELIEERKHYRLYKQGNKVMGIYTDFMNIDLQKFKNKLLQLEANKKVMYSFSFTEFVNPLLIDDIENEVEIKVIPTKILLMLDELRK